MPFQKVVFFYYEIFFIYILESYDIIKKKDRKIVSRIKFKIKFKKEIVMFKTSNSQYGEKWVSVKP